MSDEINTTEEGDEELKGRQRSGKARMDSLTQEERKALGRQAAAARWQANIPTTTHEGDFLLAGQKIECANLPGGVRVITQADFLRVLGRSRSPKAGTGVLSTVDDLPFFLQADALKPFISDEIYGSTKPLFFKGKNGAKGVGYDATLLPKVAEVYLRYRDDCLKKTGEIPSRYEKSITAADILMRGLAHVGIISLVDDATGFTNERARDDLAKILEKFVAKELQPWVHTFKPEFYEQMFRLRGLPYSTDSVKRPSYFGHLTNDVVYRRLAPGVLQELKDKAEKNEQGRSKHRLHQKLTVDIGHPKLRDLITSVTTVMKLSGDWGDFKDKLERVHPAYNATLPLPFDDSKDTGRGI